MLLPRFTNWAVAFFWGLCKHGGLHIVTSPSASATVCRAGDLLGHTSCGNQSPCSCSLLVRICMHILLRLQEDAHWPPVVLGRYTGTPHAQRLCQQRGPHAFGDDCHTVTCLPCSARCATHCTSKVHCLLTVLAPCRWTSWVLQNVKISMNMLDVSVGILVCSLSQPDRYMD